ncbi:hypothetical protein BY996DRAFT_6410422 [Phakopsora pachyrhizi]|nr:hypothetical protein BY996DRAFT_6410422 [Phakopsora pachyrhizi]
MGFLVKASGLLIVSLELSIEGTFLGDKNLVLNKVAESYEPLRVTSAHNLPQIPSTSTFKHMLSPPNLNIQEPWATDNQDQEQIGTQWNRDNPRWNFADSLSVFPLSNSLSAHFPSYIDSLSEKKSCSSISYDSVEENSHFNPTFNGWWINSNNNQLSYPEINIDESYHEIIENYLRHEQIYGMFSDQLHMHGVEKFGYQELEVPKTEKFSNFFANNTDLPSARNSESGFDWISFLNLNPSREDKCVLKSKENYSIKTSEFLNSYSQWENIKNRNGEDINFKLTPDSKAYSHSHFKPNYFHFKESESSIKITNRIQIKENSKKIKKAKTSGELNMKSFTEAKNSSSNGQLSTIDDGILKTLEQPDLSFKGKYNVQLKINNQLFESKEKGENKYMGYWNKELKKKFDCTLEKFKRKIEKQALNNPAENIFLDFMNEMDNFVNGLSSNFDHKRKSKSKKLLKLMEKVNTVNSPVEQETLLEKLLIWNKIPLEKVFFQDLNHKFKNHSVPGLESLIQKFISIVEKQISSNGDNYFYIPNRHVKHFFGQGYFAMVPKITKIYI